jgi:hypothetical protein
MDEPTHLIFRCRDLHRCRLSLAAPVATLAQEGGGGDVADALNDLRITGWPFVALMEAGKRYEISVREVAEESSAVSPSGPISS